MRRLFIPLLILLSACAASAGADPAPAAPVIAVIPAQLDIRTLTDGKTSATVTRILYAHSASDIKDLVLDASDLVSSDAGVKLDFSNVRLTVVTNLAAGADVPVSITIAGLQRPGHYTGAFRLRSASAKLGSGSNVSLAIEVGGKPNLVLGTPSLTALDCFIPFGCGVAARLLGTNTTIAVTDQSIGKATNVKANLLLRATRSNSVVDGKAPGATISTPTSIDSTGVITLCTDGSLPADRYQGYIAVNADDVDTPVYSNITLDVRHDPWIALVVIIGAILLGRLVQSVTTPTALAQQRLFGTLYSLQAAASGVDDAVLGIFFARRIEEERQAIAQMVQGENDLNTRLVGISTAISAAQSLQWIEKRAADVDARARDAILTSVRAARNSILAINMTQEEIDRIEAQRLLLAELDKQGGAASAAAANVARAFTVQPMPAAKSRPGSLKLLQALAGSAPTRPEVRYALLKPALYLLLLIGLILVGMYNLYVKNTTFGADVIYDYFGLAVWGLSADVAQRTLQSLQFSR